MHRFIGLCFVVISSACLSQSVKSLEPKDFQRKIAATENAVVLDVRTPEEFEVSHLKSAINIDVLDASFEDNMAKLDKGKVYFVYCKAGKRSTNAVGKMKEMGFKQMYNLEGGMTAWEEENLPIDK